MLFVSLPRHEAKVVEENGKEGNLEEYFATKQVVEPHIGDKKTLQGLHKFLCLLNGFLCFLFVKTLVYVCTNAQGGLVRVHNFFLAANDLKLELECGAGYCCH